VFGRGRVGVSFVLSPDLLVVTGLRSVERWWYACYESRIVFIQMSYGHPC
jgi:hypothetical protein